MEQLLSTKFYIPPTRRKLVSRPRLVKRINAGLHRKLTLISAPAGFGKTTLVSEWVERTRSDNQNKLSTAWLSLDEHDNDLVRFLTYLIAALQRAEGIDQKIGSDTFNMLQSPQPPPTETIMISLINDITALSDKIILILDDYHLISDHVIDNALTFLLEHLPPQMHLIITTRVDPQLPLARLRAGGQLNELRATDLRFTTSEAIEFLNQIMDLNLSGKDIATLETRTEGWIAGLQLAAISMQGREDTSSMIRLFTGSHRLVLDYLIEEVLEKQPENVQNFLLQTAVLDRLTGPLCDALTGKEHGQATLEMLEHTNLFIIPLDVERRWYRYHHLFADLLQQRLHQSQSGLVSELHLRASNWYEQNNFEEDAIEHALAAGDFVRAGNLIEELAEVLWERGEHVKLMRWLNKLSEEQLATMPQLNLFHSWILHTTGQEEAAEKSLQTVERVLSTTTDGVSKDGVSRSDHLNTNQLKSRVTVMHAMSSFRKGDIPNIIKFSRKALETLPENDLAWRGMAAMALGDSYGISGNMNPAKEAYEEAVRISKKAGNVYSILYTSGKLGIIFEHLGKFHEAQDLYRELMPVVNGDGLSQSVLTGVLYALWGEILCHWNDIDNAFQYVSRGVELSEHENDVTNLTWTYNIFVKVLLAKSDFAMAKKTILKLEKIARESLVPPWMASRTAAWKARIWLTEGNFDSAQQWIQERLLNIDDGLHFAREPENIVLARFLVARGDLEDAVNLLERMIKKAEAGDRITRLVEMLLVLTLALKAQGDSNKAMTTLEKALSLAEPGGYIRFFIDEGPPIAKMLYEALDLGISPDYVSRLLNVFPEHEPEHPNQAKTLDPNANLIEPLTERECEVLRLIAEGLTNQGIATRLFLSMNTIKVHTRNIFGKLNVSNRMQAVARAKALGILPPE